MLEFHALQEHAVAPSRLVALLLECRQVLVANGMASMSEYGDMLTWGLPSQPGVGRGIHVFHPGFCSFSDAFYGTIHYHGGWIRGTILLGGFEHHTYKSERDPDGDRFFDGDAYRLEKHTRLQEAGASYVLPARVPHWLTPTALTLTFFEEEDNGEMGDLVNPASSQTDDHVWTQEQADALLPELLALIDERIAQLTIAG